MLAIIRAASSQVLSSLGRMRAVRCELSDDGVHEIVLDPQQGLADGADLFGPSTWACSAGVGGFEDSTRLSVGDVGTLMSSGDVLVSTSRFDMVLESSGIECSCCGHG